MKSFAECRSGDEVNKWMESASNEALEEALENLSRQKETIQAVAKLVKSRLDKRLNEENTIRKLAPLKVEEMKTLGIADKTIEKVVAFQKANKGKPPAQTATPGPVLVGSK